MPSPSTPLTKTILLTGILVSTALVASAAVKAYPEITRLKSEQTISISGEAHKTIDSNRMKWSFTFDTSNTSTRKEAQAILNAALQTIKDIAKEAGVTDLKISDHPATFTNYYRNSYDDGGMEAYESSGKEIFYGRQKIDVESKNVRAFDGVTKKAASALRDTGSILEEYTSFYLENVEELRKELFEEALANTQKNAQDALGVKRLKVTKIEPSSLLIGSGPGNSYYSSDDISSLEKYTSVKITAEYIIP